MERANVPSELALAAPLGCTVEVANNHEKTWRHLLQWTSESNRTLLQSLPAWLSAKLDDPTWAFVFDDFTECPDEALALCRRCTVNSLRITVHH
jgi:hypothetical protein